MAATGRPVVISLVSSDSEDEVLPVTRTVTKRRKAGKNTGMLVVLVHLPSTFLLTIRRTCTLTVYIYMLIT